MVIITTTEAGLDGGVCMYTRLTYISNNYGQKKNVKISGNYLSSSWQLPEYGHLITYPLLLGMFVGDINFPSR